MNEAVARNHPDLAHVKDVAGAAGVAGTGSAATATSLVLVPPGGEAGAQGAAGTQPGLRRLRWLLRRHAGALTLAAGVSLMVAASLMQWLAVRPLQARLDALEHAGAAAGTAAAPRTDPSHLADTGPRGQLASFYAQFERTERLNPLVARLHGVARSAGVEMLRAEYRLHSPPERKLDRYEVVMPVRGSYRAIRGFIGQALRQLPTMTLDHVQFQRQEVGDPTVDAQVTFSLHLLR